jgi:predicted lipid-binding transport protein (Tim44 family)
MVRWCDGDPADTKTIRDAWTFSRDVGSRDPKLETGRY